MKFAQMANALYIPEIKREQRKFPSFPPSLSLSFSVSLSVCAGKHLKYHHSRNFIFIQVEYLTVNIFVHNSR